MIVDLKAPITNLQGRSETTNKFLVDIRKYPVLTVEEEKDIIKRIKNGDELARRTLIESNQRFVFAVARKYARDEHHLMDLVSEGNVGLIKAIDNFDPSLGFKFITHAVWYIRREISAYIVNTDTLVRKTNISKTNTRLRRLNNEFFLKNGRTPSVDELKELFKERYNIEIKNDTISKYQKKIFNVDTELVFDDFNQYGLNCKNNGEKYYCLIGSYTDTLLGYSVFDSAYEYQDKITVVEYYLQIDLSDKERCLKFFNEEYCTNYKEMDKPSLSDKTIKENGVLYKHVFYKEEDKYYLENSFIVSEG